MLASTDAPGLRQANHVSHPPSAANAQLPTSSLAAVTSQPQRPARPNPASNVLAPDAPAAAHMSAPPEACKVHVVPTATPRAPHPVPAPTVRQTHTQPPAMHKSHPVMQHPPRQTPMHTVAAALLAWPLVSPLALGLHSPAATRHKSKVPEAPGWGLLQDPYVPKEKEPATLMPYTIQRSSSDWNSSDKDAAGGGSKLIPKRKKPSSEPPSPTAKASKKHKVDNENKKGSGKPVKTLKVKVESDHQVKRPKSESSAKSRTPRLTGGRSGNSGESLTPRRTKSDDKLDEMAGVEAIYVPCEPRVPAMDVGIPVFQLVPESFERAKWTKPCEYVEFARVHEMYDLDEEDEKWLRKLPVELQLAANIERSSDLFELLLTHFEYDFSMHHRSPTGSIFTEVEGELPSESTLRDGLLKEIEQRCCGKLDHVQIAKCYEYWCHKRSTHRVPLLRQLQDVLRPTAGGGGGIRGQPMLEIVYAYSTCLGKQANHFGEQAGNNSHRGDQLPTVEGEGDTGQRMCDSCGRWGTSVTVQRTGGLCICRWCLESRRGARGAAPEGNGDASWTDGVVVADMKGSRESQPEDYIGVVVEKVFSGYGLCRGTVRGWQSEQQRFKVEFNDGDEELYEEHELRGMLTVPQQAPAQPVTEAGKLAALEGGRGRSRGRAGKGGRGRGNMASPKKQSPAWSGSQGAPAEQAVVPTKPCGRFGHKPDCVCHLKGRRG